MYVRSTEEVRERQISESIPPRSWSWLNCSFLSFRIACVTGSILLIKNFKTGQTKCRTLFSFWVDLVPVKEHSVQKLSKFVFCHIWLVSSCQCYFTFFPELSICSSVSWWFATWGTWHFWLCLLRSHWKFAIDKSKFLIDGFPRNKDNLDGWQKEMGDKTNVKFVLFFDCSQEVGQRAQLYNTILYHYFLLV